MINQKLIILLFSVGASSSLRAQLYMDGLVSIDDNAILYADTDVVLPTASAEVIYSGELRISGSLLKSDGALFTAAASGARTVSFVSNQNSADHHIEGVFIAENSFHNLVLDFDGDDELIDIDSELQVANTLALDGGILRTDTESHDSDGSLYRNTVVILSPLSEALQVASPLGESGPYIEGKLERAMGDGVYDFPIGISNTTLGKQPLVVTTDSGNDERLRLYFQDGATTAVGTETSCDLGEAPNYNQPDGTIDAVTIDCVLGQWVPESTANFDHQIALYPSSSLSGICEDAVIRYVGVGGAIEDCPSFTSDNSVIRSDLQGFEDSYDIATASMTSISTATIEVDGAVVTTSVYPNPVLSGSDVLLDITGDVSGDLSYEVFTIIGEQVIENSSLQSGVNSLNVSSLQRGQYILRLHVGSVSTSELIFIR